MIPESWINKDKKIKNLHSIALADSYSIASTELAQLGCKNCTINQQNNTIRC